MIDLAVNKIARKMVDRFPEELPPYGITRYGLKFIVVNILPVMLLLLVGFSLNIYNNVLMSVLSFSVLRVTSGGYHSKFPELCLLYSSIVILSISAFAGYLADYIWLMNVMSLILVGVYAPSNIENQTKILSKYFVYLKYISLAIVLMGCLLNNTIVSCSMLAQSLLLIRLKGGEKK